MAKGTVSRGTGLNMVAKLSVQDALKNADLLIKKMKDINAAASGTSASNPNVKAFDTKPLTEYQSALLKIKQEREAQASADKSASLILQNALKEERLARAEISTQIQKNKLDQQQANIAAKEASNLLKQQPTQKRVTQVSNSQAEIDAYNRAAQGSNLYTSAINAQVVARARLNAEAARTAIANGTLTTATTSYTSAAQQQAEATNKVVLSKKQLAQMLAEEKLRQAQNTAELKNNAREMLNAKGSIDQRKAALERLIIAYRRMSEAERDSAAGNRMAGIIARLRDQIKELEGQTKNSTGGISGFFEYLKNNILSVLGPIALITAAWTAAKALFNHNVEISDNFTDVQRTAKLSADEVDNLSDKLKKINTRTNLEGLLDIGFEGGRLGVAKEDLVGFITTVDQLSVVLKKELPGGAEAVATSLGKIAKIYKITENEGITLADAMNKIGSSQLELAHAGGVTVKYLQDFTLGVAGTAVSAKLSLPVIEGYGAVMSGAGTIASSAALSITRLVTDLSVKRDKYYAIAQLADSTLTIEKFNNLINTDTKAALDAFFKGLKAGSPTQIEFNDRIRSVGITTGKVANAVKTLANNQDILSGKVAIGTKGYEEGTSVAHNFELANNSLAASYDKIKNAVVNYFTSASNGRALAGLLNSITDNRTETDKLADSYFEAKHKTDELNSSLNPLVTRYDVLKAKGKLNREEQIELNTVTAKIGELLPNVITSWNDYGIALDINRGKVNEATKAQKELLEAQNRTAIAATNADFDSNAKKLSDINKNRGKRPNIATVVYEAIVQGSPKTDKERKDATDKDIADITSDQLKKIEKIKEMGGKLNKVQQDLFDQYNTNKKSKEKQEVLGSGENPDAETSTENTIAKMKSELKTLILANSTLGTETKKFQDNLKRIKELKKEIKLANGGKDTEAISAENKYQAAVTARNALQEKITQLTNAGLNKQLSVDDAEVDSVREKYRKMGAEIEEFNRKYKGKVKVDTSGLATSEKTEVQRVIDKQSNARLKDSLAQQAKDFEEFENYKIKYGAEAATKRFNYEDITAEAYLQKLEMAQKKVLDDFGDPSGYTEAQKQQLDIRTEAIKTFTEKQKAIEDDNYARAYEGALTNAQKLAQINTEYERDRRALGDKATADQLLNLNRIKIERIRAENEANAIQKSGYEDLMHNFDTLTRKQILNELNAIKAKNLVLFNNGKLSAEQLANLNDKIDGQINNLNANNPFDKITAAVEKYKIAVGNFKPGTEGAKQAFRDLAGSIGEFGDMAAASLNTVGDILGSIGIGGEKFQQAIKGVSGIASGIGDIGKSIKDRNPVGIVTGSIKLLTSAISLFNNKDKKLQKQIDGYKAQLDSLGKSYKQLERDVTNSVGESIYTDQAKQIENLKQQQAELVKSRDAESQKKKKDQGKIDDYNNQIDDIPNKIDDINRAISQNLIQGTFKDLSNSLADAFADAFRAGENGIEKMDDVFNNFIANAIKNSLKLKILDPVVKGFTDDLTQYAKDNKNSIVGFDFDKWKAQLKEAGDQFNAGLKGSEQFFKPDSSNKVSSGGTIRAELTEQTGGKLEGIWRAQYDLTKNLVSLSTERNAILMPIGRTLGDFYNLAKDQFMVEVRIEANTLRTADNTEGIGKKLDQIITNTKGGPSARGAGYQSL